MDSRIVHFIGALRASGVRVSLAESEDAMRAIDQLGVEDRELFRLSLKATLVKEAHDGPTYDRLFPLYFGSNQPPMLDGAGGMSSSDQEKLADALRQMLQELRAELMRRLAEGQPLSPEELEQLGQNAGLQDANQRYQQQWITRRVLQQLGLNDLAEAINELMELLAALGMDAQSRQELRDAMEANGESIEQQVKDYVGQQIAENMAKEYEKREPIDDLMHRPFASLTEQEADELRTQVQRLAAQLRSRAALRQKRGKDGTLDPKATLRANLKYGSVPIEMKFKHKQLKPKLVLIADVSTSMRPVAEFMVRLMYELSDQIARARSFAFINHIHEVSQDFDHGRASEVVQDVLEKIPPGYYNTDLGSALADFTHDHFDAVDHRTTVIFLGDGRNNFNDPRLDLIDQIKRRAKRVLWFNPEHPLQWRSGDSDMLQYAPLCDSVHQVSNLAELAAAVDRLFD
jgi:uncharacterized protein with von Willebrand factor type A (vWA) domain